MKTMLWFAAATALTLGCTNDQTSTTQPGSEPPEAHPGGNHDGSGSGSGALACSPLGPSGSIVDTFEITGGQIVAVDPDGNMFYTANQGIVKLDALGNRVYDFPFGSVLAVDAEGMAYVAGSFTAPIVIGGQRLVPNGNIDVFVAKLDANGKLMFVEALALCGDGVESIAVDLRGRIAVSGTAMGTAVLDASGRIEFVLPYAGQLAFDSHGNLIVAGSFTGSIDFGGGHVLNAASSIDIDAFLVKVDHSGDYLASIHLGDAPLPFNTGVFTITEGEPQIITNIAINAKDEIAILGSFPREMNLFGTNVHFNGILPSGSTVSPFVAKLDASMNLVFSETLLEHYSYNPNGGVAIDANGFVAVSFNSPSQAFFPYGFAQLALLDARTGAQIPLPGLNFERSRGYGLGIAFDSCGNLVWADTEHARVMIPLRPMLRVIAR
jgi:hypothetical protein